MRLISIAVPLTGLELLNYLGAGLLCDALLRHEKYLRASYDTLLRSPALESVNPIYS